MDKDTGSRGGDFLSKPFDNRLLLAKIQANLRRVQLDRLGGDVDTTEKGVFCLDASMREVVVKGRRIRLSQMEFRVLNVLMERPRVCYSGEELFKKVWGVGGIGDRKTVQVHIHNLRRKIEEDPENPCYLKSERGRGYWLEVEKKENKD